MEFDAMLRRHLSRGGSMVEACGGFDADTASAYLEDVLSTPARSRYDAHLAGCPACRRHVIELSRLITLPQVIQSPQTVQVPVAESFGGWSSRWERLRAAVAGWTGGFGLAPSKWGLATAGAVAAVLIGVFSIQLWRQQQTIPQSETVATNGAVATADPSNSGQTPQATPGNPVEAEKQTDVVAGNQMIAPQTANVANSVPQPVVGPMPSGTSTIAAFPTVSGDGANRQVALNTAFNVSDAVAPGRFGPQVLTLPQPPSVSGYLAPNVANGAQSVGFPARAGAVAPPPNPEAVDASAEKSGSSAVAARINPLPSDNPMVRKGRKDSREAAPRSVFDKALSFLPTRDSGAERKLEEIEIEKDAPKLLTIRVRDKVLSYQSGMWIDEAYKPEMAWRVTKLVRGSEEFKQVLASEPQLREFFERGPILVIWKDKIYKVVDK